MVLIHEKLICQGHNPLNWDKITKKLIAVAIDEVNRKILSDKRLHFDEVINRLKDLLHISSDRELSDRLEMSPNAFHNRKKSASIPYSQIVNISYELKVNLNWLLVGEGPIYKDQLSRIIEPGLDAEEEKSTAKNKDVIIIEHQNIVTKFKDPEKAKEFNEYLLEIERDDPEGYDELYKEAKTISKTIKRIKQQPSDSKDNSEQQKKIS